MLKTVFGRVVEQISDLGYFEVVGLVKSAGISSKRQMPSFPFPSSFACCSLLQDDWSHFVTSPAFLITPPSCVEVTNKTIRFL